MYDDKIDVTKGIMLIRLVHLKNVLLVIIGIFYFNGFGFNQSFVMDAMIC